MRRFGKEKKTIMATSATSQSVRPMTPQATGEPGTSTAESSATSTFSSTTTDRPINDRLPDSVSSLSVMVNSA